MHALRSRPELVATVATEYCTHSLLWYLLLSDAWIGLVTSPYDLGEVPNDQNGEVLKRLEGFEV